MSDANIPVLVLRERDKGRDSAQAGGLEADGDEGGRKVEEEVEKMRWRQRPKAEKRSWTSKSSQRLWSLTRWRNKR